MYFFSNNTGQYCVRFAAVYINLKRKNGECHVYLIMHFLYRRKGPFNESAYKNKQMLSGGNKTKCALQTGYFDTQFKRIFEREALTDPIKIERQYRIQQTKKNLSKAFLPSNGEKKT